MANGEKDKDKEIMHTNSEAYTHEKKIEKKRLKNMWD